MSSNGNEQSGNSEQRLGLSEAIAMLKGHFAEHVEAAAAIDVVLSAQVEAAESDSQAASARAKRAEADWGGSSATRQAAVAEGGERAVKSLSGMFRSILSGPIPSQPEK